MTRSDNHILGRDCFAILIVAALPSSLSRYIGCLKEVGTPTLSIEEIKKITRDGWAGER
jgi:hypothetical protein